MRASDETRGQALVYFVGLDDAARSAEVAAAIDARFAGGDVETLTESERSFFSSPLCRWPAASTRNVLDSS